MKRLLSPCDSEVFFSRGYDNWIFGTPVRVHSTLGIIPRDGSKGFRRTNHTSAGPDTAWKITNHSSEGSNTTCDINIQWDNWSKATPLSARPRHRTALV